LSQNAKQAAAIAENVPKYLFSYTLYDALGRITEVGQIEISNFPWVLNTNKCHSVYCPEPLDPTNPRLSLFFKWRKTTFVQVINAYQQYAKIKI
jgi:hypothetical protein